MPPTVDEMYSAATVRKLKMVKLNENTQIAWEKRAHSVIYSVNTEGGKKTAIQVVHQPIDNFDVAKLSAACIIGQKDIRTVDNAFLFRHHCKRGLYRMSKTTHAYH